MIARACRERFSGCCAKEPARITKSQLSIHVEPKIFQLDPTNVIYFMCHEVVPSFMDLGSMHDGCKIEPGHLGVKFISMLL
jgi:hypothetical protein